MAHENVFVQYLHESGDRGADQGGSINWFMGMARRPLGRGRLGVARHGQPRALDDWRAAAIRICWPRASSATGEPFTIASIRTICSWSCRPTTTRRSTGTLRWQVYGGPAGEPALGPVAFPHRLSAMPNPVAPISHHWLDATHVTFGVVTGGVYGARWKAEASVFNGREPDEHRTDFDFGALDSVSGRLRICPRARWPSRCRPGGWRRPSRATRAGRA